MRMRVFSGLALAVVAAGLFAPTPAKAWWVVRRYYAPRVVVVGPPVVVQRPIVVVPRYWVPPHLNAFGYFVPGHWRFG